MALNEEISRRMNIMRFPLILGVMYVHNYHSSVNFHGYSQGYVQSNADVFLRNIISQGLAGIAVPTFFMISGYLFFYNYRNTCEEYFDKITKRVKTLIIPYVLWSVFVASIYYAGSKLPFAHSFFKDNIFDGFAPNDIGVVLYTIGKILGFFDLPLAYHLWFVRDLIVLCLISPVIYYLTKKGRYFYPTTIFVLWCTYSVFPYNKFVEYEGLALLYFSFGAWFSITNAAIFTCLDRVGKYTLPAFIVVQLSWCYLSLAPMDGWYGKLICKLGVFLGVVSFVYFSNAYFGKGLKNYLVSISGGTFFIYCAHEPLLTIVRKLAYVIVKPDNVVAGMALYFFIPLMVGAFLLVAYCNLKRYAPGFLQVVSGGR